MPLYRLTITEPLRVGHRKQRRHTAVVLADSKDDVVRVFRDSGSVYDSAEATYEVFDDWGSPVAMLRTCETV